MILIWSVLILQLEFDSLIQLGRTTWRRKGLVQASKCMCCIDENFSLFFTRLCMCGCNCDLSVVITTRQELHFQVVFSSNTGFNRRQAFAWLLTPSRSFFLSTLTYFLVNIQFVTPAFCHDGYWNVSSNSSCLSNPTSMSEEAICDRVTYIHKNACVCVCVHVRMCSRI
jgi:hypothetical protein